MIWSQILNAYDDQFRIELFAPENKLCCGGAAFRLCCGGAAFSSTFA